MSSEPTIKRAKGEKRKRDSLPEDEIEVDVNLPEPPSKKALRKAKKLKSKPHANGNVQIGDKRRPAQELKDEELSASDGDLPTKKPEPQPAKTAYGIWVGNLPFSATKAALLQFFREHAQPRILPESITRINIPAPANARASQTKLKPMNKGFAYIDFSDQQACTAALALTETPFGGRNILIKDSKNFEGRPEQPKTERPESKTAKAAGSGQKAPSKRVFVGNLSFDVTVEDLQRLYEPCGAIEHVHMATFEDSGKCKGFAWVTFQSVEAATAAVQGWTRTDVKPDEAQDEDDGGGDEKDDTQLDTKKRRKTQKWFVNRLQGRTVRCEFAEDPSTRYKKRFGKEAKSQGSNERHEAQRPRREDAESQDAPISEVPRNRYGIAPGAGADASRRRGRNAPDQDQRRTDHLKKLQDESRYRTGALTESTGTKIKLDA